MTTSATAETLAPAVVKLDPTLDISAAERLHKDLVGLRGRPLTIDASDVQRLGGLCLQVLLSARATWRADDRPIALTAPSTAFERAWASFGAPAFPADPNAQGTDA
jgi:chemotaxis protein CheX